MFFLQNTSLQLPNLLPCAIKLGFKPARSPFLINERSISLSLSLEEKTLSIKNSSLVSVFLINPTCELAKLGYLQQPTIKSMKLQMETAVDCWKRSTLCFHRGATSWFCAASSRLRRTRSNGAERFRLCAEGRTLDKGTCPGGSVVVSPPR